jgi:hypothetical protein
VRCEGEGKIRRSPSLKPRGKQPSHSSVERQQPAVPRFLSQNRAGRTRAGFSLPLSSAFPGPTRRLRAGVKFLLRPSPESRSVCWHIRAFQRIFDSLPMQSVSFTYTRVWSQHMGHPNHRVDPRKVRPVERCRNRRSYLAARGTAV